MTGRRVFGGLLLLGFASVALAQDDAFTMMLKLREQADRDEVVMMAAVHGLPIRQVFPDGRIVELVRFRNGRPMYYETLNVNAALTTRANRVHPGGSAGLSLNGSGVTLGIWDGGSARSTHQEFTGRITLGDGAGHASHATHVAGTMVASGVDAAAKGMSYAAQIRSYDWNRDSSEMSSEGGAGLVISNHSYGFITGWSAAGNWYWYGDMAHTEDAGFGFYDSTAQAWDQIANNRPNYLIFKSAGNDRGDGPANQPVTHKEWNGSAWVDVNTVRPIDGGTTGFDTLPYNSTAKNIMIIGAVDDVTNYTGPASVSMSSFSGWGPTDDGRIKPDIVANGVSLYSSTNGGTNTYGNSSGTSMSSPNAAGSAGLIVQHYRNRYGTGGNPASHWLRGLIIHTADECGANPGPDYAFGWGLMNVEAACALITENTQAGGQKLNSRARIATVGGGVATFSRKFQYDGSGAIKVTICWNDPAGTPPAWQVDPTTPMLVHDLDVRVIGPGGTAFPWVLNPASPSNAATTGDNVRDNVEQVYIPAPVAGEYTVTVSHKGSMPTQEFSLFTDNLILMPGALSNITISPTAVTGGNNATATINLDAPSDTNQTVTLVDNGTAITTPPSVTFNPGESSKSVTLNTLVVPSFWTGTVTATLGSISKQATLSVMPALALQAFSVNRDIVIAGETSLTGLVVMTAFTAAPTTVTLSDNSAFVTVPASIVVSTGTRYKTFAVTHSAVSAVQTATISATYLGVTKSDSVTLSPPPVLTNFVLTPSSLKGGTNTTGTVTLSLPAPTGGTAVGFSTNTTAVLLPAKLVVPSHATTANATIGTVAVPVTVVRTVSAIYRGVVRSTTITITP